MRARGREEGGGCTGAVGGCGAGSGQGGVARLGGSTGRCWFTPRWEKGGKASVANVQSWKGREGVASLWAVK